MRKGHWILLSLVLLGACQPVVDARTYIADEFESTYSTFVREDLPAPAGVGDAPLAGSLGPPDQMVQPEMTGTATMTREGSSGPPMRSGAEEPQAPVGDTNRRQYLQGHDADAH